MVSAVLASGEVAVYGTVMRALILHASAGGGHRRAADALERAFRMEDEQCETFVCDILDFTPALFKHTYAQGYLTVVRRTPELWGYMYTRADRKALVPWRSRVRATFNKINTTTFFRFYRRCRPDVTVCTHFMPLEILSSKAKRQKVTNPFYCCVTDFAVHSLWVLKHVDCYYVAGEEAARQLLRRGQPGEGIRRTGIPVDPVFAERLDASQCRRKLGLAPDRPTILVLSGGFGIGAAPEILKAFEGVEPFCQIAVVAGANERVRRQAERSALGVQCPVKIVGHVDNMHEWMSAADLVVTKPGGLTTSEALAKRRPLVITEPIPGQEQRNCDYLLEAGAAVRIFEPADAPEKIRTILDRPARLQSLQRGVEAIARPHAARDIARDIIARFRAGAE